jgi:hypothetical protein
LEMILQLPLQWGQGMKRRPPQPSQELAGCSRWGCGGGGKRRSKGASRPSSWSWSTCSTPPM